MNMQQLVQQAQKMKREIEKAQAELDKKEFTVTKGGAVTVVMLGSKEIKSISIDEDAFDKENKEMVEDMIALAVNELIQKVQKESDELQERITGSKNTGFGF